MDPQDRRQNRHPTPTEAELTAWQPLFDNAKKTRALLAELQDLTLQIIEVVGDAIGDLYHTRRRDDLTLLYFTGHGLKDDHGRLYLAMTDTKRDRLRFTGLSAEQIDEAMESCLSVKKCWYSTAATVELFPLAALPRPIPK